MIKESCSKEVVLPKVRNSSNNSLCYENGVFKEDNYKINENDEDTDKIIKNFEDNTKKGDRRIVNKEILFLEKLNILKKKVILEINNIFDHEAMTTECIIENGMFEDAEKKDYKKDNIIKNNNILKQIVKLQLNDKGYYIEVMCIN
jgi:hypothetical protein